MIVSFPLIFHTCVILKAMIVHDNFCFCFLLQTSIVWRPLPRFMVHANLEIPFADSSVGSLRSCFDGQSPGRSETQTSFWRWSSWQGVRPTYPPLNLPPWIQHIETHEKYYRILDEYDTFPESELNCPRTPILIILLFLEKGNIQVVISSAVLIVCKTNIFNI